MSALSSLAQNNNLNNTSINNQQLGLSGPLSWGVTYSDLVGTFFNGQYVLALGEQLAVAALGEYGSDQYRFGGTVGYGFNDLSQVKLSAERLDQRLPFQFDTGNVNERVHQDAVGIRFQQVFELPILQNINAGGYYAKAANKNLAPVTFTTTGLNGFPSGLAAINFRHLAGATSQGVDAGTEFLVTPSTKIGTNLYYDQLFYHTAFNNSVNENRNGLGGSINIDQILNDRIKFSGGISVREIYDLYQGGISWLPGFRNFGLEMALVGQHVTSHNQTPNNSSVNLQLTWMPEASKGYDTRFNWRSKQVSAIANWVQAPAIHMEQVLVIAEQITQILNPTITGISPIIGPNSGGNPVTITGSNFAAGVLVFFGGQLAENITLLSPSTILVIAPPLPQTFVPITKTVDVSVQNPDGQLVTLYKSYTYTDSFPTITSISPSYGPVIGGTTVVITGTNFAAPATVTFNGQPATNVSVDSDTQITATLPAGVAGPAVVVVNTPNGSASTNTNYSYVNPPLATGISPNSGSAAGEQTVIITGQNFIPGVTQVNFGNTPGTSVQVNSSTQITVVTPALPMGSVPVNVITPGGTASPGNYTFVNPMTMITSVTPLNGNVLGGDTVVIQGADLNKPGFTVTFDGINATIVSSTPTQLTVTTPAHAAGAVNVTVNSYTQATFGTPFVYGNGPVINSIVPANGSTLGTTQVQITGTDLSNATVTVNGQPASATSSPTTFNFTAPASATTGQVLVVVTTPFGSTTTNFNYYAPPVATSLTPAQGIETTLVTITGSDFVNGLTSVTFDGSPATSVNVVSSTSIEAVAPAHLPGVVNVVVSTPIF